MDPGAFSGQSQGWKTPKGTLWQYAASVYVAVVHCWEILGVSRSVECDFLSVLSIYPRTFLSVFIVYRLLLGISCVLVVSVLVVSACQVIG